MYYSVNKLFSLIEPIFRNNVFEHNIIDVNEF
ncbi:hypothetical protein B0O79_1883 [Flavobacteriaceae bacterium MAR_2009_75]|nr:hypothetical protein B0O79_1883 [Flavobacteriaceae bacterium MAR_2009_75]